MARPLPGPSPTPTPAAWREHLLKRRTFLITRLHQVGEEVATEQPQWASDLGPLPDVGDPRVNAGPSSPARSSCGAASTASPAPRPSCPCPMGNRPASRPAQSRRAARAGRAEGTGPAAALPLEGGPRRSDGTPSRRELVAGQLRPQVTSLRRQLTPRHPRGSRTCAVGQHVGHYLGSPVPVQVTSNWRDLFAASSTLSPPSSSPRQQRPPTPPHRHRGRRRPPTPEVTMSRYTTLHHRHRAVERLVATPRWRPTTPGWNPTATAPQRTPHLTLTSTTISTLIRGRVPRSPARGSPRT